MFSIREGVLVLSHMAMMKQIGTKAHISFSRECHGMLGNYSTIVYA